MKNTKGSKPSQGFTLIELLVVIAIIAILAAILFPVFARARENARRASCQSNLKQIALGVFQYTQDYDEKFPLFYLNQTPLPFGWADAIQPYLRSTQIYQCPSESTGPSSGPTVTGYTDYSYNEQLGGDNFGGPVAKSLAILTQPTLTVMLADDATERAQNNNSGCNAVTLCGTTPGLATFGFTNAAIRHLDGQNFAFADGHVKWYAGTAAVGTTTPGTSKAVYNALTPGSGSGVVSGSNPTYNISP